MTDGRRPNKKPGTLHNSRTNNELRGSMLHIIHCIIRYYPIESNRIKRTTHTRKKERKIESEARPHFRGSRVSMGWLADIILRIPHEDGVAVSPKSMDTQFQRPP